MNYEYLSIGAGALAILLLLAVIWLWWRVQRLDKLRAEFMLDQESKKLDDIIVQHNQGLKQLNEQLGELGQYTTGLANANKKNFQKIGFIRFNPFDDAGGSISFVLAVLNYENSGFVLSSLHGREGDRVYSKEIKNGKSKSPLTEEEQEAINQAI